MSDEGRPDIVRIVVRRILPYAILCAIISRSVAYAAIRLANPDTYFHLRFGHEFLTGRWSLWHPGQVSTFGTAHWVPTQWLSEIVMAQIEDIVGLAGVAWLSGLLYVALILTWYLIGRRHAEPVVAALVTALAYIASWPAISMRPQLLSFIAVAITVEAWLRARASGRRPWWLIALTWVWAMCHGMWPVGIIIGLAAALGIAAEQGLRAGMRQLAVPVATAVACALTPVGPRLYPAVLLVDSRGRYFSEWDPENFKTVTGACVVILLAVVIWLNRRRAAVPPLETIFLLGAVVAAVYSQRTVPLAASMLVPLACLAGGAGTPPPLPPWRLDRRFMVAVAGLSLLVLAVVVPATARKPMRLPRWLDTSMAALPPGTKVLDDTRLGAYLMWAHPQIDIVSHGYGDVFTDSEIAHISTIETAGPGWVADTKATGAVIAVQQTGSPLGYDLQQLGWTVVHKSGGLEYLTAPPGWLDTTGSVTS